MRIFWEPRFGYPGFWRGEGWCEVSVYLANARILVFLYDHDDHENTSVTNTVETVCHKVWKEVLEVMQVAPSEVEWLHLSITDSIFSLVRFADPEQFVAPRWRFVPQSELDALTQHFCMPGAKQRVFEET